MSENHILELVQRIEALELELTIFNAKRALACIDKELRVERMGGCSLLYETNSPDSAYYNRVKGFGAKDLNKLELILEIYKRNNTTPCFDMTPHNLKEEVSQALSKHGFAPVEQLVFMQLASCEYEECVEAVDIIEVTQENAEEFINIIMASRGGMDIGRQVIERKKQYFCRPDFCNYIAYIEGEVAGIASLFISGREGYIANDYTFDKHRGRGVQKALLAHRINKAVEAGLENLYTDVEFGSVSHNNMEKMGFRTVFINSFWMKLS